MTGPSAAGTPAGSVTPTLPAGTTLASTGANAWFWLLIGIMLLAAGALVLTFGRGRGGHE